MQIYLIKTIFFIFKYVPDNVASLFGHGLGLLWFYVIRFRRTLVFDNLRQAFGEEKSDGEIYKIARANFLHYGRSFVEYLKMPSWSNETILSKVSVSGLENFDSASAQKKGALVICGHYGNFDLANVAQAAMGIGIHVITKKAKNESVDKYWQKIRTDKGIQFLPSKKSAFSIVKALRRNEMVALIFDQHAAGKEGVRGTFFGRPASTMKAVALLARKMKCPVLPVFNYRQAGVEVISVGKEIPFIACDNDDECIRLNTQNYNDILEDFIRKHPEQWFWVHRRWK